jgi:uncharacterized membrane protein YdjX (TVP38/TMEM64 family)
LGWFSETVYQNLFPKPEPLKNILLKPKSSRNVKIRLSLILLVGVCFSIFIFDAFSFSFIKSTAMDTLAFVDVNPIRGAFIFAVFYFLVCAFPTPFVSLFTMVAGYFFGNVLGLLIVSFMSALGGTVLFLMVRYGLRDWVSEYVSRGPEVLQQASTTNSFMVALSVRFIPGLPFSFPALVLGLSQLSVWKFYCSTQLGLLLTLLVYVNAGRSLAQVNSVRDVFSAELILSMLLLFLLGFLMRFLVKVQWENVQWVKVPRVFTWMHKKFKKAQ